LEDHALEERGMETLAAGQDDGCVCVVMGRWNSTQQDHATWRNV